MTYLSVAFDGALGAMFRDWVYNAFLKWDGDKFPYATLTVNIVGSLVGSLVGSFFIGLFSDRLLAFVLMTERVQMGDEWRGVE